MIKKEIRIVGIDDAPFNKSKDKDVLIVGTIFRGGSVLDGVISCKVKIDGDDATRNLINLINKTKHKKQLKVIMLKGIAVGGFNIIDIKELNKKTGLPVVVIIRKYPDMKKITMALKNFKDWKKRMNLIKKAGKIYKLENCFVQFSGIKLNKVKEIVKIATTRGLIPEPIRTAHLIASGVTIGESRGRA